MRLLHLSADYPDPLMPAKTRAVSNLLELVPGHRHRVYSLNRVDWRDSTSALSFRDAGGTGHRAVAYGAPPRGIRLVTFLERLADWIAEDIAGRRMSFDLIHAHKLSVEGIVAARLAKRLDVPYCLSIQGNSDLKIIRARPDLRGRYRAIWQGARAVFPFAPWANDGLTRLLGARHSPTFMLPCPTPADRIIPPRIVGPVFRTALNLHAAKNKNIASLIEAVALAAREVPEIRLDILGGGDARAFARLNRLAERRAPGRIVFRGAIENSEVQDFFNAACGFALVSHRESYGMVYAEALLAGAPCLIPRGRAIDGYFPEASVIVTADPGDVNEIAAGLVRLAREEVDFKDRLFELAEGGALDLLRREHIARTYREGLNAALGAGPDSPAATPPGGR